MRKIINTLIFILVFVLTPSVVFPADNENNEKISSFKTAILLFEDGSTFFQETIKYNFPTAKHGIFRQIPLVKTNQDGKDFRMKLSNVSVDGYKYQNNSSNKYLDLKIGDPNKTITGLHSYDIEYEMEGAVTYFTDHDELYWNVTGDDWDIPIEEVNVYFDLPSDIEEVTFDCFTGYLGENGKDCNGTVENDIYNVYTTRKLEPNEGLTVVFGFPKGIVAVNEPVQVGNPLLERILSIVFTLLGIGFYLVLPIYIFSKKRKAIKKHPEEKKVVAAWFEPPKTKTGRELTAGEVGTISDKSADIRDVTASIIQLAQKGFIKITETSKKGLFKNAEFSFIKQKDWSNSAILDYEKKLLDALFLSKYMVTTKEIGKRISFASKINKVFDSIYQQLVDDKLLMDHPKKVKIKFGILLALSVFTFNVLLFIVSLLCLKAIRKSDNGAHAIAVATSLKNFVKSQDAQFEFQAKNQMLFEKLLPYAIALGIENIWVERFSDINLQTPDWLETSNLAGFSYASMVNNFNSSVSSAVSMSTTRSSTGHSSGFSGGLSGGGGGGGGGGSW